MHVGVLSIQFNKKSIDRVFLAGMRFIAGSSQLLEKLKLLILILAREYLG